MVAVDLEQDCGLPAGKSPQRRWATTEDWATHKETIINLYSGQNMTLKQVVTIMRDEHQFFATWVSLDIVVKRALFEQC